MVVKWRSDLVFVLLVADDDGEQGIVGVYDSANSAKLGWEAVRSCCPPVPEGYDWRLAHGAQERLTLPLDMPAEPTQEDRRAYSVKYLAARAVIQAAYIRSEADARALAVEIPQQADVWGLEPTYIPFGVDPFGVDAEIRRRALQR